jgi:hypothetical protein
MAGWVRAGGYDPFVTDAATVAFAWVRERPREVSFFDRGLERLDGEEVWRVVRRTLGHRPVLMAADRTKELWFSALAEGVRTLLPLPAEREAVLSALSRAGR